MSTFSTYYARLLEGDEKSWNQFMAEFNPLVSSVAKRCSPENADDIVQEVYVLLIGNHFKLLRRFDGQSRAAFLVYLKRIAENTARNYVRKHTKRAAELGEVLTNIADERPNAEGMLLADTQQEALYLAVRKLRRAYRDVIELLLKGYLHREIAELLEIPLGTSITRANRATAELKKLLASEIKTQPEYIFS